MLKPSVVKLTYFDLRQVVARVNREPVRVDQSKLGWSRWCAIGQVTTNLCGSARAKDSNVRQAIIDRYGGPAQTKKGGVLYGISKDVWAALGVGLTFLDMERLNGNDGKR